MKYLGQIALVFVLWFIAFFVIWPPHAHCYPKEVMPNRPANRVSLDDNTEPHSFEGGADWTIKCQMTWNQSK